MICRSYLIMFIQIDINMFKILGRELGDKGYFVNLDSSTDRYDGVMSQVKKYEIEGLEKFSALSDPLIQFACTKSHLGIFEIAKNDGLETIVVLEDDMEILENPYIGSQKFELSEQLDKLLYDMNNLEWDVILLGCNPKTYLIPLTENLSENYSSSGSWAYIIKRRAYEYILENSNYYKDYVAIDDWLAKLAHNGFKVLATTPQIIHHGTSYQSTLQPRGLVNYTAWIDGNWEGYLYRFLQGRTMKELVDDYELEREITIVVVGHFVENFLFYLRYLLKTIPKQLERCRFLIIYDNNHNTQNPLPLEYYFKDRNKPMNYNIIYSKTGISHSMKLALEHVKTKYFLFLEHDWIFLDKRPIDFLSLKKAFDNHHFVNAVWFNKDDNQLKGFEICGDRLGNVTPYEQEHRVTECDLTKTIRWSNNPVMFRKSKMQEWFDKYIDNDSIGKIHQGQYNVEDNMIRVYRQTIEESVWEEIKDDWGTFLHGKPGDCELVGHTDGSRRYQTSIRTMAEDNADEYVRNNPLPEND